DVLEDTVVGRRRPAHVVLGGQPVDRHDHRQPRNGGPLGGNRTDGARHHLDVEAAGRQLRQQLVELPEPHQRLTADDGDVYRLVAIDERVHAVDERLPLEVAHLPQRRRAAEVIVAVRVAAGTTEGTLTGDFDRQGRWIPTENPPPRREYPFHAHPPAGRDARGTTISASTRTP